MCVFLRVMQNYMKHFLNRPKNISPIELYARNACLIAGIAQRANCHPFYKKIQICVPTSNTILHS